MVEIDIEVNVLGANRLSTIYVDYSVVDDDIHIDQVLDSHDNVFFLDDAQKQSVKSYIKLSI